MECRNSGQMDQTLIPNIDSWLDRSFGEVDFYVTQFLTGHGCFGKYLFQVKKRETPNCPYCGEVDSAEHTILFCVRWTQERSNSIARYGMLDGTNIIELMLRGEREWCDIVAMIGDILRKKKEDRVLSS